MTLFQMTRSTPKRRDSDPSWIGAFLLLTWPAYLNDLCLPALTEHSLLAVWAADIVLYSIVPILTGLLLLKSRWLSLREFGMTRRFEPVHLVAGFAVCPLYAFLVEGFVAEPLSQHRWGAIHSGYGFPEGEPVQTLTILYASLSAGFIEEVLFRGFLTRKLIGVLNSKFAAILCSSLLFALIHWGSGIGITVYTFLWAVPVNLWFVWKHDLWTVIVFHSVYDFIVFKGWI